MQALRNENTFLNEDNKAMQQQRDQLKAQLDETNKYVKKMESKV